MNDNYKNAFQEVYYIIENYDRNSVDKISTEFIEFIKLNRNEEYNVKIDISVPLDSQELLYETKVILAWMYQEYFSSQEEKKNFEENNLKLYLKDEEEKKRKYKKNNFIKSRNQDSKLRQDNINEEIIEKRKETNLITIIKKIILKIFRGE